MGTGELGITTRKPVEDQTFGPVRGSTWSEVEGQKIAIAGLLTSGSLLKSRVEIAIKDPVFPHEIATSALDDLTLSIEFHILEFFPFLAAVNGESVSSILSFVSKI